VGNTKGESTDDLLWVVIGSREVLMTKKALNALLDDAAYPPEVAMVYHVRTTPFGHFEMHVRVDWSHPPVIMWGNIWWDIERATWDDDHGS
jgi:hypothetical protein